METPLPQPDKLKSLNVDESRAKRLERQHARIRDRGGIFRPENNSNLFELLRSATHRKSPNKGKGRSRSRSVSPLKKSAASDSSQKPTGNKRPTRRSSIRKTTDNAALAPVSEVAEDEIELQEKSPKAKQKADEVSEKQPRAKTKKSAPAGKTTAKKTTAKKTTTKKTTAKKPRRATKQLATADESQSDGTSNKTRQTKPRLRGKRKNQDADTRESESPPDCPPRSGEDISTPLPANCPVPEKVTALPQTQKPPSKAQRPPMDQAATTDKPNEYIEKPSKLPPKPNSRKRKVEKVETDDEPRPQKVHKLHSKSQRSKTPNSECKSRRDEPSEAGLACKTLEEVHVNRPCNVSKKTKRVAKPGFDEAVDTIERSGAYIEETESKMATKTTTKRSRLATEDDGEPAMRVKKTKTDPLTDVLKSKGAVRKKPDSSRPKSKEKSDNTGRRPKTHSGKRKENSAGAEKKPRGGRGSKNKKQGSGLPAHIRQKLDAQRHDKHTSDDEPDPIDFLS